MPRSLRISAAVVLMALLPLRAVAGVTIGICPAGHEDMAVAAQVTGHAHVAHSHERHADEGSPAPGGHSCNVCAEHCSSAAFAPVISAMPGVQPAAQDRHHFEAFAAPAFVPEQPDRPPLA